MRRLDSATRSQVIGCLIEGCAIRATVRLTGVAKETVIRVLVEVGEVCADYQDRVFRNLRSRRLQLDELWSWVYCKEKNRTEEIARKNPHAGDIWLWVAVDADSKLVPSWMLGKRDFATAQNRVHSSPADILFGDAMNEPCDACGQTPGNPGNCSVCGGTGTQDD